MFLRTESITAKKFVGKSKYASLIEGVTPKLWQSFMPYQRLIQNALSNNFYAIQQYDSPTSFISFTPETKYTQWAAKEVKSFNDIPDNMDTLEIKGGLYAVFLHKGTPAQFSTTMQFIFGSYLPSSEYELDGTRVHFQLMDERYKNNHPDSEEEVWIPIIKK